MENDLFNEVEGLDDEHLAEEYEEDLQVSIVLVNDCQFLVIDFFKAVYEVETVAPHFVVDNCITGYYVYVE